MTKEIIQQIERDKENRTKAHIYFTMSTTNDELRNFRKELKALINKYNQTV